MRRFGAAMAGMTSVVLLAACSNSGSGGGDLSQTAELFAGLEKDQALVDKLPDEIKSAGVIRIATDQYYPPFESVVDGELVGLDVDLANGIGILLGVDVKFVNTSFDAIIPALAANKVDMAMSSIGDTKDREEIVDFATYYHNTSTVLVKEGNPEDIVADATCGAHIGAIRGTLEQNTFLPAQAVECEEDGQPAPQVEAFQTSPQAVLALQSGRIDGYMDGIGVLSLIVEGQPGFEIAGPSFKVPNPGGVAFPKGSALVEPVHEAINALIEEGTYAEIFEKWELSDIAISESEINGATI